MRCVVVTGTSAGVGWGTAIVLIGNGFRVVGSVRAAEIFLKNGVGKSTIARLLQEATKKGDEAEPVDPRFRVADALGVHAHFAPYRRGSTAPRS